MVKNFFSVNWEVLVFCPTSESALNYDKSAQNHQHAMTMLNISERGNWSELLILYVRDCISNNSEISVNDYIYHWMLAVKNSNYVYLFQQTALYFILFYR